MVTSGMIDERSDSVAHVFPLPAYSYHRAARCSFGAIWRTSSRRIAVAADRDTLPEASLLSTGPGGCDIVPRDGDRRRSAATKPFRPSPHDGSADAWRHAAARPGTSNALSGGS
jgi:hypothetical protein